MDSVRLKRLLRNLQAGTVGLAAAVERLRTLPYEDLGFASVDHHRSIRQGFPEVVFCEGKTRAQIVAIARDLLKKGGPLLATRVEPDVAAALGRLDRRAVYHDLARVVVIQRRKPELRGDILVVTAGTADIPVAEEAKVTAEVMGSRVESLYDVGVAGIHRVLGQQDRLLRARVLVVVAGMDGVLSSAVGGSSGGGSPDQPGVRRQFRGTCRPPDDAEFVRVRRRRDEYRQWLRRRLSGPPDQYAGREMRQGVNGVRG